LENITSIALSLSDITNKIHIKSCEIENNNLKCKEYYKSLLSNINNQLNNVDGNINNIQSQYDHLDGQIVDFANNLDIIISKNIDINHDIQTDVEDIKEKNNTILDTIKGDINIIKHCNDTQKIKLWRIVLTYFIKEYSINVDIINDKENLTGNYSIYRHIDALLMFLEGKTYTEINDKYQSLHISRLFNTYIRNSVDKFSHLYPFLPDIIPLLKIERLKRRKIGKTE
jgi:hypothetical protein